MPPVLPDNCLHSLQGMFRDMGLGLAVPAGLTLLYVLLVIIQPPQWYNPQYAVPLMGMLLGNALNGVTVGVKSFLEIANSERTSIEWALAMGATRYEAFACAPTPPRCHHTRATLKPCVAKRTYVVRARRVTA